MKPKSLKTILAPQGLALNIAKAGKHTQEEKQQFQSRVQNRHNNTLIETPNFGISLDKKEHQFILLLCELMASPYAHDNGVINQNSASRGVVIVPNKTDKGKPINESLIIEIPLRELVKRYWNRSRPFGKDFKEVEGLLFDTYELERVKDPEGNFIKEGKGYKYAPKKDSKGEFIVKRGLANKKFYVSWTMKQQNGKYSQQFTHEELFKVTPILTDLEEPIEYDPNNPEHVHAKFYQEHRKSLKLRIELNAVFAMNSFIQIPADTRAMLKNATSKAKTGKLSKQRQLPLSVEVFILLWYLQNLKRQKWAKEEFKKSLKQAIAEHQAKQEGYLKEVGLLCGNEAAELLGSISANDTTQIETIIQQAKEADSTKAEDVIKQYFDSFAEAPTSGIIKQSLNLDTALNQLGLMELYKGRRYDTVENGNKVTKTIKPKPDRAIKKIDNAFAILQKAGFVHSVQIKASDSVENGIKPIKWEYILKDTFQALE